MTPILQRLWDLTKKNWQLLLLVVVLSGGYLYFKRSQDGFVAQLKQVQDIHEVELKKVVDAQVEERLQHEANLKKLQDDLSAAQVQHDTAVKVLEVKKQNQVTQLVHQYAADPTGLAKKLNESMGFQIILPEK